MAVTENPARRAPGAGARPKVVVIGAGFAGLNATHALRRVDADIIVVDKNNYHTFQPLLYQVSTGYLPAEEVGTALRSVFRRQRNVTVHMATAVSVNWTDHRLMLETGAVMYFDYLIITAGAETNFFDVPGMRDHAWPLYTLNDALQDVPLSAARFGVYRAGKAVVARCHLPGRHRVHRCPRSDHLDGRPNTTRRLRLRIRRRHHDRAFLGRDGVEAPWVQTTASPAAMMLRGDRSLPGCRPVIEVDRGQILHLVLGDREPDAVVDSLHVTYGYGNLLAAPKVALLEKHMSHVVIARIDDQSLNLADGAIGCVNPITSAHLHFAQRHPVNSDG